MPTKLNEEQIQFELARAYSWTREGDTISRTFTLPSFAAALLFASTVGHLAEAMNHHPDILIQWKKVTLTLSTHDVGGLSDSDFALAGQIDALPMKG